MTLRGEAKRAYAHKRDTERWSADQIRRHRAGRSHTERMNRLTAEQRRRLALLPAEYPEGARRPCTRADCASAPRPCPWVSCYYHLYLEVTFAGNLRFLHPNLEPDQLDPRASCALDVADRAERGEYITLEIVGAALNITRERARQIEVKALGKVEALCQHMGET